MALSTGAEPPPRSTDVDGWRDAVMDGRFRQFRLEDVVAAIQDLGPCADRNVLNPLAKHLSDALLHILRKHVSVRHRNRGDDIIERAHGQMIDAVFRPDSADGKALRQAFVPRVRFRVKDALAAEARAARAGSGVLDDDPVPAAEGIPRSSPDDRTPAYHDPTETIDESIDVETILEQVPDDRKRLAFRLYMDDIPFKSTKSESISAALGVSEKTASEWVKEVRALLASAAEVQELLKPKQMRGNL
jgi:RNA polymerase sigma factor (sigma-70 family)